jgi:hypothetical protein
LAATVGKWQDRQMRRAARPAGRKAMTRTRIALGLAAILLATLTASQSSIARPLSPEEEARVQPAGKPEDCLSIARISETRVRNDHTIDFIMHGGRVYRNSLPNSCPSLGFEERFSYETSTQELCSSDVITVLQSGPGLMRGASCGLGQFQPVTGVGGK